MMQLHHPQTNKKIFDYVDFLWEIYENSIFGLLMKPLYQEKYFQTKITDLRLKFEVVVFHHPQTNKQKLRLC